MTNTELKNLERQIKDLSEILLEHLNHSPSIPKNLISIAKMQPSIRMSLDNREAVREIRKRKLTNKFIQTFNSLDVEEALEIDREEARKK
ncbi:MAG: hypothetical protein RR835_12030, partial [Peptostreptococcaceae bacterium]